MKTIFCEEYLRVIKNKKKLEAILNVKIVIKDEQFHGSKARDKQVRLGAEELSIDGKPEDEYIAEKVIDAIGFGFPLPAALLIKKRGFLFEILNIKDYTPRKDFGTIRARIIGSNGKTLRTLSELTECNFEIKVNEVGIIGSPECIKNAQDAVISIIRGAKQANVYSYLEKHHAQPVLDLGLKERKKKTSRAGFEPTTP